MANFVLRSVQDSLRALMKCSSGLEIDLEEQIVTWADRHRFPDHVKIISGGGAGHEPGHVGFVGRAFLTTAVSGAIFTSPPVQAILKGILLTGPPESSILLIVTNYSGDRLNFALAERMARVRYGYRNIRTILVADDIALEDVPEHVGKRGLAGTVLIHKIAGAMAAKGESLDRVFSLCEVVNKSLRTIGFSFDVDWTSNWIRNIEIGKGVHGEPGATKMDDQRDFSGICLLVAEKFKQVVRPGVPVVLLLNNLGGPTHLFQVICCEMIRQLQFLELTKIISGSFFTSLGNAGASVTLLELPQEHQTEILSLIEYETELFYEFFKPNPNPSSFIVSHSGPAEGVGQSTVEVGVKTNGKRFFAIFMEICERVIQQKSSLNEMDSEFGDSDTGDTLERGAMALREHFHKAVEQRANAFDWPFDVFQTTGYLLSGKMGGTSGALLGIFFASAAEAFKIKDFGSSLWLRLGNDALASAGRSSRGQRTMLDVLLVAQDLMETANPIDESFLLQLRVKCREMAEATKDMVPGSGRAVYSRNNAINNKYPDPGAMFVALAVDVIVELLL